MTTLTTSRVVADDPRLREQVLRCYKPHCRYLRSATATFDDGRIRLTADFSIPESCYIDDTGHLNAVEVNICYNQMLYLAIATCVREKAEPVFAGWTMEDFLRRQLPSVLIARMQSVFTRGLDARGFSGEFRLDQATARRLRPGSDPLISLSTSFRYWDQVGDGCHGTAAVAVVPDSAPPATTSPEAPVPDATSPSPDPARTGRGL